MTSHIKNLKQNKENTESAMDLMSTIFKKMRRYTQELKDISVGESGEESTREMVLGWEEKIVWQEGIFRKRIWRR